MTHNEVLPETGRRNGSLAGAMDAETAAPTVGYDCDIDGDHCRHWYDGDHEPCCFCGDGCECRGPLGSLETTAPACASPAGASSSAERS